MKEAGSIKAKWDKLHLWSTDTYMWVFVNGRMFVINESGYEHKKSKLNKTVYEKIFINKTRERNK